MREMRVCKVVLAKIQLRGTPGTSVALRKYSRKRFPPYFIIFRIFFLWPLSRHDIPQYIYIFFFSAKCTALHFSRKIKIVETQGRADRDNREGNEADEGEGPRLKERQ